MIAGLGGSGKVGLGIPTAGELFNGRDIDGAVVQKVGQSLHISGDEVAID